jgi:AcrR family transcriptional regulator
MTSDFDRGSIDDLTRAARIHNEAAGITGMLFCFSDRFIQVLEGPGPAVAALHGRIQRDPRHRHVTTVQDLPIEARAYTDWAMRRFRTEDLGEAERRILFRALSAFEPRTILGPKPKPVQGPAAPYMDRLMARVVPARLPMEESEAVSSLLYAAEVLLLRDADLDESALPGLTHDAHVNLRTARRHFPTIADLIRTCVLRILALQHQALLTRMLSDKFEDEMDLADCIVDYAIKSHQCANASTKLAEHFALHSGASTCEAAGIIAAAVHESPSRGGWPFTDLSPTILAMSIAATNEAACIMHRSHEPSLTLPRIKARLLEICLTALVGRPASPPEERPSTAKGGNQHDWRMNA